MAAATLIAAPVASASTKGHNSKKAQQALTCKSANGVKITGTDAKLACSGLQAYRGKTITFIAPDKPGGGFDQFARAYQPYLSQYLGATVNVTNIPAGNTVAGQNYVASTNSSNPGYTVGWLNAGPDIEDSILGLAGIQFNPTGEAFLGSTAPDLTAMAAINSSACAAWDHGFAAMLKRNSASNKVEELIQSTGSTTFTLLMINGVFGIHYHATPGYASSADLVAGWLRGDGCVIDDPVSVLGSYVKAGKATPLLVNSKVLRSNQYYAQFVGVPTFAQAEKLYGKYIKNRTQKVAAQVLLVDANTSRVFFTPPKTPQNLQAALRSAFKWASFNSGLQAKIETLGASPGYQTPTVAKSQYIKFLNGAKRVKEYLAAISG